MARHGPSGSSRLPLLWGAAAIATALVLDVGTAWPAAAPVDPNGWRELRLGMSPPQARTALERMTSGRARVELYRLASDAHVELYAVERFAGRAAEQLAPTLLAFFDDALSKIVLQSPADGVGPAGKRLREALTRAYGKPTRVSEGAPGTFLSPRRDEWLVEGNRITLRSVEWSATVEIANPGKDRTPFLWRGLAAGDPGT